MAPTFQASKFALLPDDDEDLNKKALRALKNGKTDTKGQLISECLFDIQGFAAS